jgi:acyl carrier protein
MLDKIREIVSKELKVDLEKVNLDTHFLNDLGADSLDAVELMMAIEDAFDVVIPDEEAQNFNTVKDVITFLENLK